MGVVPGGHIGPFEILGLVGAGGMGAVYRGRDPRLNRIVAIKVIAQEGADPYAVQRFESEALSASALNHPNILTVYEFGVHEGLHYLVTELVEGETLRQRLQRGPIALNEAVEIARQVGGGLEAAHAAGLIHRDIKPENIMLRPDGYIKILDFGLAKLSPTAKVAIDSATITMRTTPGMLVGTIGYMAPEQVRGLPADERADVWSFGIVLHEMITGHSPFAGATTSDVIASILQREPPALSAGDVAVPAELEWIVGKALAKNRENRYQTITDALIDLRRVQQQTGAHIDAPSPTRQIRHNRNPRRRTVTAVAGLVALSLVLATAWRLSRGRSDVQNQTAAVQSPLTVTYWLTVQRMRDGKPYKEPFPSAGLENFESGWKYRLNLQSAEAGFMYLLNDGPARGGRVLYWLYPSPAQSTAVRAGEPVQTPWYVFDPNPGTEEFWIVWSAHAIPAMERARRWFNPDDVGEIRAPDEAARIRTLLFGNSETAEVSKDRATEKTTVKGQKDLLAIRLELKHH